VVIDGVTVIGPDGDALGGAPLARGADLEIIVHARVVRPTAWITGFTLNSTLGHAVYRLNTEGLGIVLPEEAGRYDVKFRLPGANFGMNRLIISAGATTTDGDPITLLDPAGHLDFEDDPVGAGVVQFAATGVVTSPTA
jgi:ABC-2 type transport system ATP-binding protein